MRAALVNLGTPTGRWRNHPAEQGPARRRSSEAARWVQADWRSLRATLRHILSGGPRRAAYLPGASAASPPPRSAGPEPARRVGFVRSGRWAALREFVGSVQR